MREAFDRKAREVSRVEEANEKRLALKAELRAERNAYVQGQVEERGKLTERHAGEDRQLQEAVRHRQTFDRVAEVQARRTDARGLSRERQQEQDRGGRSIGPEL